MLLIHRDSSIPWNQDMNNILKLNVLNHAFNVLLNISFQEDLNANKNSSTVKRENQ